MSVLLLLRNPYYLPRTHPQASPAELHGALERTREAYVYFRSIPAPKRGEIIRQIRVALAAKVGCYYKLSSYVCALLNTHPTFSFPLQRDELGALVSLEMGKIRTEGIGEVQEFVDIVSSKWGCRHAVYPSAHLLLLFGFGQ